MSDLCVLVGERNGDGKRPVTYRFGEREYPDRIDVLNGWAREQSLKRALESLGLPADNLPSLGAEVVRLAMEKDAKATNKAEPRFETISSAELAKADYTPTPIITDALFAGVPAIIGAPFKTCKSLVATDAAISIATGRPFLNSWSIPQPLGVDYYSGEGGACVAQDYGQRTALSKGIDLGDATQLRWCFSVPRLESLEDLDAFARELDNTAAEVVILDNLMLCLSGDDASNVYKMGSILGNVIRLCSERNVTPVFIHHFKRTRATADPFAPGELADLTQAGAAEIAGQWWLLTRRKPYDPEYPGEHKLWFSVGGRVGHSSLHALDIEEGRRTDPGGRRWDVEVRTPDAVRLEHEENQDATRREKQDAKRQVELENDRREIVQAATKVGGPETKNNLRERVSCGYRRYDRAFASLTDDGTLEAATVTKPNGHSYDGWRVRND